MQNKKASKNDELNEEIVEAQGPQAEQAEADSQEKIEELSKSLDEANQKLAEQKELLLRTAAEFDNFKKRTEREKDAMVGFIRAQTVRSLLSAYDNLERAVASDSSSADYVKGIELTVKQMTEAFTKLGLEEIEALGSTFDPNFHEAIMHIDDENAGESVVVEVLQKGYKIGETVLRHAMVKVAN